MMRQRPVRPHSHFFLLHCITLVLTHSVNPSYPGNDEIESQLKRDRMMAKNEIKMLLLGAGESGKVRLSFAFSLVSYLPRLRLMSLPRTVNRPQANEAHSPRWIQRFGTRLLQRNHILKHHSVHAVRLLLPSHLIIHSMFLLPSVLSSRPCLTSTSNSLLKTTPAETSSSAFLCKSKAKSSPTTSQTLFVGSGKIKASVKPYPAHVNSNSTTPPYTTSTPSIEWLPLVTYPPIRISCALG